MAIVPSPAAVSVITNALAESHLARSARHRSLASQAELELGGQGPALFQASPPLPVYSIPQAALIDGVGDVLKYAQHSGWRVLTTGSDGPQLVEIEKETHRALAVRRGSSAGILQRAGMMAERVASIDVAYEPRILDFGRLGLSALWLHSDQSQDLFFTLESDPQEQSETTILNEAMRRAHNRREASDNGGSGPANPDTMLDIGG